MRQIPHVPDVARAPGPRTDACHVLTLSASPVVGAGADDDDATRATIARPCAMDDARRFRGSSVGRSVAREDADARTCEDGTTKPVSV